MPGCALLILFALALFIASPDLQAGDLPLGFVVGLVAGLLVGLLRVYNAGWNAHVDEVEGRAVTQARDDARRDRK